MGMARGWQCYPCFRWWYHPHFRHDLVDIAEESDEQGTNADNHPEKLYTVTFKCIGYQHDRHVQDVLEEVGNLLDEGEVVQVTYFQRMTTQLTPEPWPLNVGLRINGKELDMLLRKWIIPYAMPGNKISSLTSLLNGPNFYPYGQNLMACNASCNDYQ